MRSSMHRCSSVAPYLVDSVRVLVVQVWGLGGAECVRWECALVADDDAVHAWTVNNIDR